MRSSLIVTAAYRRERPRRRWTAAWLAATAVLSLTACTDKQQPTVASAVAPGATATAAPGGTTAELAAYVQGQREWAACLRKQGVANVPDPDEHGEVDIISKNPAGPSISENRMLAKATAACKQFERQMSDELAESLDPPLTATQIAASKALAECMRSNGVPDFPDPKPNGRFGGVGPKPGMDSGNATYQKASDTCMRAPGFLEAFPD